MAGADGKDSPKQVTKTCAHVKTYSCVIIKLLHQAFSKGQLYQFDKNEVELSSMYPLEGRGGPKMCRF